MAHPEPSLDVDGVFARLGARGRGGLEWRFVIAAKDGRASYRLSRELQQEHVIEVRSGPDTVRDGRAAPGAPVIVVVVQGVLTPAKVRAIAAKLEERARAHDSTYAGVSWADAAGEAPEEWLTIDAAVWRLRHFTDTGLAAGAAMGWVFGFASEDEKILAALERAAGERGYTSERGKDKSGRTVLAVRCDGVNDDPALRNRYAEMEEMGRGAGAEMVGVALDAG